MEIEDVRHLALLRELAARGSVTAVARATHRTPSAVSQQLRAAQRAFDAVLVEPSGRGLRLTEAGRRLARSGERIARVVAEADADWTDFCGTPTGTVTLAALPSAAAFLLPPLLARLAGGPIQLECVDLDIAEHEYAALANDHDVVVAHTMSRQPPAGTDGLSVTPLVREPLDIAMDARHRLVARDVVRPVDLADEEWIGVPPGYPFDAIAREVAERVGRPLRITQRLRDNRLVESLIIGGDRIAVLPRFTTPTVAAGAEGLVLRALAEVPASRRVLAIARPDRAARGVVRHVVGMLRQIAGAAAEATGQAG